MRKVLAAGTALLCLAAVGCSKKSDDTVEPEAGGSSSAASSSAPVTLVGTVNDHGGKDVAGKDEFELELDDFYFGPTYVKATPGAKLKVELSNEGKAPHTFTIDALKIDKTLQPGDEADVEVTLPATGATVFYCKFHKGQGMQGAFYFNAGDTAAAGSSGDGGAYGQ